ncbi:MAG: hypothetical protein AB3N06_06190 [Erythrobacter sp.]
MSRRWWVGFAISSATMAPVPLAAQATGEPPERIDILVEQDPYEGPLEDCSAEQEAALISGEIIVCRRRRDGREFGYDSESALSRYAEETMDAGDPRAPELAPVYPGIVVARGCFIPPCPPPKAYIIDFGALPDTPPGSDADRIGRGLAPQGRAAPALPADQEVLGLPPAPGDGSDDKVSPSGSASPAEEPSG